MCTQTAASASPSEPVAVIWRAGPSLRQNGIRAGTSIRPAPWMVDTMQDHSASAAWRAGGRPGVHVLPGRRAALTRRPSAAGAPSSVSTASRNSAPASSWSAARSIAMPSMAAAATSTTDAVWPAAIGSSARRAGMRPP
ncbi:hypothetical protein ASD15_22515 [Massilia sp. Root351]|nr:hypothetical protein ASD15_22515 [Massilia sp. Root351]